MSTLLKVNHKHMVIIKPLKMTCLWKLNIIIYLTRYRLIKTDNLKNHFNSKSSFIQLSLIWHKAKTMEHHLHVFNSILTLWLFYTETFFIYKFLSIIITIFPMFHYIFSSLHKLIWHQVFLSDLYTIWFQLTNQI